MTPSRVTGLPNVMAWPLRAAALVSWLLYVSFFSIYLASGDYIMVGAMAGLLLCICVVMYDWRFIAVLWFAGAPTIFVFANNFLNALPFVTIERTIFFGLSLFTLGAFAMRKREGLNLDTLEKLILAFLGILLVAMLRHIFTREEVLVKAEIAFYLQGYFMPMLSYWLMRRLNWTEAWVMRYLWAVAAISILLGFQGVAQTYLGMGFFMPTWIEVINEGRATGVFSNATEFGIACLISMLYCLLLQNRVKDKALWTMLLILAGSAALGLFLCKTRAPWLAALICLMIVFYHDRRQRPLLLIVGGLGTLAVLLLLPFIVESETFQGRLLELSPIYSRIALYASGVLILLDHPIMGIGLGKTAFESVKSDYLVSFMGISYDAGQRTGPPHNEWLGIMTMTGIFGIGTFVAIHVAVFKKLKSIRHDLSLSPFQRLMSVYVMAIFISQIVISMFVDLGYFIYTTSATYSAVGIVAAHWAKDEKASTKRPRRHRRPDAVTTGSKRSE